MHFDSEILIRLLVSIFLGLIIGLEREITNKAAGLRTHILVCLGAAVFTVISVSGISGPHDQARIAAQIVTGIGFIGGGAVLHHGMNISGITTAATLWVTASIGMAVGAGSYDIAIFSTLLTFIVLAGIRKLEHKFLSRATTRGGRVKITVSCEKENQLDVQEWFYKEFENIQEISASRIQDHKNYVKLSFIIDIQDKDPVNSLYKKVSGIENIEAISIKQVLL